MSLPVTKYTRQGNIHTIDFDIPAMGKLVIDYDKVEEADRAGIAKALLSMSALACYVNTLSTALDARGAQVEQIHAEANLVLGKNDNSQARISGVDLKTKITLPEDESVIFERCQKIMRNGCLVTASIHEGLDMQYDLEADYKDKSSI